MIAPLAVSIVTLMSFRFGPIDLSLLRELHEKHPPEAVGVEAQQLADDCARDLRAFYHTKQRAFFIAGQSKRKATTKTRRAGATAGGVREIMARSVEQPKFRATYVGTTRDECKKRAWESDTQTGFIDILREKGELLDEPGVARYRFGGLIAEVREIELRIEFSNGSQIELFGADNERALNKQRGVAKHVFWVDEAQDFRNLDRFYKAVIAAAMNDFGGECWLTGTPGQDCAGFFWDVTKPEDGESRLEGWEVHRFAQTDNPYFGAVTQINGVWHVVDNLKVTHGPFENEDEAEARAVEIRWENTAGKAIRENGWKHDDPDLLREQYGQWVRGDARFVFPVHTVPAHVLCYAPQRLARNPVSDVHPRWYDHQAAMLDLPVNRKQRHRPYQWLFAIGSDYGYHPDPFAIVVWAFTQQLPDIYEMFSWKSTKVLPDDQARYLKMLWDTIDNIVVMVGDPAGKQADFEAWRTRLNLPIDEADKAGRNSWEEFMAADIRMGRVHYREDSPLLQEHRHLVYLPTKPGKPRAVHKHRRSADGLVYGDDLSCAAMYASRHLTHYLYKPSPKQLTPGSPEAMAALEVQHERAVDKRDEVEARAEAEDRWSVAEQEGDYEY